MTSQLCEEISLAQNQTVKEVGILTRHLLNLHVKVFNLIVLKYQVLSSTECWILNLNICGSCIHCQLVSKWDISALNVRTLFVVTDLFIQFVHVKSVHAHSKINNALLDSIVCAQCCAD